jgi:hypothetical protein
LLRPPAAEIDDAEHSLIHSVSTKLHHAQIVRKGRKQLISSEC